tara:strand:- start:789 stop:1106 length:318 start_codon:yes stop_codon:yes gene_type:complete
MSETKNFFGRIRMPYRVCDANIKQVPQGTWGLFAIDRGSYSNERYNIYVLLDNTTIYMKPSQPYYSKEFEDLFGFSIECSDYDSDKVIMVKDPMYYKQFVDYFPN